MIVLRRSCARSLKADFEVSVKLKRLAAGDSDVAELFFVPAFPLLMRRCRRSLRRRLLSRNVLWLLR